MIQFILGMIAGGFIGMVAVAIDTVSKQYRVEQ